MSINKNNRSALSFYHPDYDSGNEVPLASDSVAAGFPSPALDFMEYKIDLNAFLTQNKLTTFYIRVSGKSMMDAGIDDGDLLVVDRTLEPAEGKIAICLIDGEFTVKRLKPEADCLYLMPENPSFSPIKVTEDNQFEIWGIVTYLIKRV
jgi:DNA polymerase V